MELQPSITGAPARPIQGSEISRVYTEGITAGILGAATVAVWFFVLDVFSGQPFYTPNVLGNVLFQRGVSSEDLQKLPTSFEMDLSPLSARFSHSSSSCAQTNLGTSPSPLL